MTALPPLTELHGADRLRAAPLFGRLARADGCVAAGLSGEFGRLWVDDAAQPSIVHLHLDFHFLAGDAGARAAAAIVRSLPDRLALNAGPAWLPALRAAYGEALTAYGRVSFRTPPRDRSRLAALAGSLPAGYALASVTAANVERFAAFESTLVENFRDLDHFLARGIGFAVEHGGTIVAGCSSFARTDEMVEVEIDTAPEHRRRGVATAAGAALALHCLEHELEPHWDAANEESAALARKLGFGAPHEYTAWYARGRGDA